VVRLLRKSHRPVFVAANKVDSDKQLDLEGDFTRLGFQGVFPVSAAHRRGLDALRAAVTTGWSDEAEPEEESAPARPTRLAIVGRPNVGKSSLINALVAAPRAIVSPVPGTTRDAVDISYTWRDQPFLFIDTAGMRQERRLHDELERAMTGRTAHAINRADVCILVIDAAQGVTMQDKKIASLIQDAHAPCMVVVNKWDLAREQGDASRSREREYYEQVQRDLFFLSYAPVLFLSAKTGERIEGLLKTVGTIARNRLFRFQTGPLNRVLIRAMERYAPPLVRGRRFKILYAAQQQPKENARQIPTLQLFVNSAELLTPAYERYLDLQLREAFDLRGCPIRLMLRGRTTEAREKTRGQIKAVPKPARRPAKR
jgi:GTP-binding protein